MKRITTKEGSMDMFSYDVEDVVELGSRGRGTTGKKRKWREIEALKDKHRLQKELQSIDITYDGLSEEIVL
jgi:hypothetical protein